MKTSNKYFEALEMLPSLRKILNTVPKYIYDYATEIRIRSGKPVVVESISERYVCGTQCVTIEEINNCVKCFCDYSIHSYKRELSEGWITIKGGHRVGLSGTACYLNGQLEIIKDISSLNIRIAREHIGISDNLFALTAKTNKFCGLLILGSPLSGKTTILRDYCRNCGNNFKTSLIDERNEIAAVYNGLPQNDIGLNTDILNCYTKKTGIESAIRVMSPEILVCDEISDEIDDLCKFAGTGVKFVFSTHCRDLNEAKKNKNIKIMLESGIINYVSFLDYGKNIGKLKGLWCVEDGKSIDSCNDGNNLLYNWDNDINRTENACCSVAKICCNA